MGLTLIACHRFLFLATLLISLSVHAQDWYRDCSAIAKTIRDIKNQADYFDYDSYAAQFRLDILNDSFFDETHGHFHRNTFQGELENVFHLIPGREVFVIENMKLFGTGLKEGIVGTIEAVDASANHEAILRAKKLGTDEPVTIFISDLISAIPLPGGKGVEPYYVSRFKHPMDTISQFLKIPKTPLHHALDVLQQTGETFGRWRITYIDFRSGQPIILDIHDLKNIHHHDFGHFEGYILIKTKSGQRVLVDVGQYLIRVCSGDLKTFSCDYRFSVTRQEHLSGLQTVANRHKQALTQQRKLLAQQLIATYQAAITLLNAPNAITGKPPEIRHAFGWDPIAGPDAIDGSVLGELHRITGSQFQVVAKNGKFFLTRLGNHTPKFQATHPLILKSTIHLEIHDLLNPDSSRYSSFSPWPFMSHIAPNHGIELIDIYGASLHWTVFTDPVSGQKILVSSGLSGNSHLAYPMDQRPHESLGPDSISGIYPPNPPFHEKVIALLAQVGDIAPTHDLSEKGFRDHSLPVMNIVKKMMPEFYRMHKKCEGEGRTFYAGMESMNTINQLVAYIDREVTAFEDLQALLQIFVSNGLAVQKTEYTDDVHTIGHVEIDPQSLAWKQGNPIRVQFSINKANSENTTEVSIKDLNTNVFLLRKQW